MGTNNRFAVPSLFTECTGLYKNIVRVEKPRYLKAIPSLQACKINELPPCCFRAPQSIYELPGELPAEHLMKAPAFSFCINFLRINPKISA
jgi:hypothetical protein